MLGYKVKEVIGGDRREAVSDAEGKQWERRKIPQGSIGLVTASTLQPSAAGLSKCGVGLGGEGWIPPRIRGWSRKYLEKMEVQSCRNPIRRPAE